MPLKFACPQCKTVISVDEKLAGRTGKCKCGAAVKIPVPRAAAAKPKPRPQPAVAASARPAPTAEVHNPLANSLASVFDELTEADYNRQSPLQNAYAPPKATSTEAATLRRFEDGTSPKSKKSQPGQLNGTLIFIAVMNFLWGLGALALAALGLVAAAVLSQIAEDVPLLGVGIGVVVAFLVLLAVLMISGGVGLLLKKKWGWFIVAFNFAFAVVDRVVGLIVMLVGGEYETSFLVGSIFGTLAVLSFGAFMYSKDTRKIYRIQTLTLPLIAGCGGVALAVAINGTLFAMGAFSADAAAMEL